MSLINDALKRAREAQGEGPATPAASPALRPVDKQESHYLSPIYFIVGMGLLVIVLGLLLIWQMAQRRDQSQRIQARTQEVQVARVAAPQSTPVPAPQPAVTSPPAPEPPVAASAIPSEKSAPTSPQTIAAISEPKPAGASTVPAVPAQPEPAKPGLKLQGIAFHPTRPAAIINGRTLFIGDRTGDWHVIAITQDTATLVNAGQTNVLSMQ